MAVNRSTLAILRRLMVSIGGETDQATRQLTRAWIRSWDELSGAWKAGLQDAVKKAADTGTWPQAWELARIERLRQAAIQSEQALATLGREAGVTVADAAGRVIGIDADFEPKLIGSQLPAAAQTEATLRAAGNILPTALNAITARTQSRIIAQTGTLAAPAAEAMRRELIKGIAVGTNPRESAARMVSRVQGAFDGGLVRATTIARTEMLDAYRATSQYSHAANSDVVGSWIWHAQLDKRTCPSCWSQHGTEYPLSLPGPWDHPQGRCARMPKTKSWRDLGFDIDEPDDDLIHAETKFWSLPADERRAIMGPGRLDLLSSGRIKWDDLSSVRSASDWRPSYTPRSVKDLQTTARLRAAGQEPPPAPGVPRSLSKQASPTPGPASTGGDPSQFVQLRPSLTAASSTRRVEKAFTAEAERITGRRVSVSFRGQDVQTAREHAEGLLRAAERFPDVKFHVAPDVRIASGTYAHTVEPNWIAFNLRFASPEGRQLYLDKLIASTRSGFHLPGVDNPAGVAAHEFGHALAFQYGLEAIARDVSRVIGDMASRAGVHPVVLVERTLGRYAAKHLQEAVGEAFSDVVMNGARATEMSKRIFAVMQAQYRAGPFPTTGFRTLPKATDSASARAAQRAAARARAAEIQTRAGIADVVAEFDEVIYKQAGKPIATVQALLRDRLSLAKLDDATRKVLQRAVDTGDLAKIRSALTRTRTKFALKPVGKAGQKVRFDDALHTSVGRDPGDGAMVTVIRQGHTLDLDGDPVQLFKAKVTPVVAAKKAPAKKALPPITSKYHGKVDGDLEAVARLSRQKPKDVRPLGGDVAKTELLEYPDGTLLVRKTYSTARARGARDSLRENADAEQLGPLVLRALGVKGPTTFRTNATTVFMRHVPGKLGEELVPWGSGVPRSIWDTHDGRLLGLADVLMGHADRHPGNWILTPAGRLAGIDHGFAFIYARLTTGSEFAAIYVDPVAHAWLSNHLSPGDIANIRTRLTALRPDFERLGRPGWWRQMMERLDEVGRHATGTRSTLT